MYLERIELENTGPIEKINYELPFTSDGTPKPVILVGHNGAGKSIVLAHIVNAMLIAKNVVFDDVEIEKGKAYKLRSPQYIRHGQHHFKAKLIFSGGFTQYEIQLDTIKRDFEKEYNYKPAYENWNEIPEGEISHYGDNFHERVNELEDILNKASLLYFPSNRFEDPAWMNVDNLVNSTTYLFTKPVKNISSRNIINYSPLRENQNWLLDLIYDSFAVERQAINMPVENQGQKQILPLLLDVHGTATKTRSEIERFLLQLFQGEGPVKWSVGRRGRRLIGIEGNNKVLTNNLFSLSTGQTILLNMFLAIIRDFDLSNSQFTSLAEIKGIVVVDEVDLHLHTEFQYSILPALIALFPKVQFILTSHSPLFLLGLSEKLGSDNFEVIDLPSGSAIDAERFSEFGTAYRYFRDSVSFENDIQEAIENAQKTLLFVEGETDRDFLVRASELLGEKALLDEFRVSDAVGYGGLDKIWKHFNTKLSDVFPQKVVLLYDCDISRSDIQKGNAYKRIIPKQDEHMIEKGIENLFSNATIQRAMKHEADFILVKRDSEKRGEKWITTPEKWSVKKKRDLCDWLISNGTLEDFSNFKQVFEILRAVIDNRCGISS